MKYTGKLFKVDKYGRDRMTILKEDLRKTFQLQKVFIIPTFFSFFFCFFVCVDIKCNISINNYTEYKSEKVKNSCLQNYFLRKFIKTNGKRDQGKQKNKTKQRI